MVCYCLDLRPDSKAGQFLANKCISLLVAVIQLMLWVVALIGFIFKPGDSMSNMHAAEVAYAILLALTSIGFSALLVVGLIKDRNGYIKAYLIFIITLIVITIFSALVNLFTQPQKFGVWGFLSTIFGTMLNLLFFFVIRNYYLSKTSRPSNVNGV